MISLTSDCGLGCDPRDLILRARGHPGPCSIQRAPSRRSRDDGGFSPSSRPGHQQNSKKLISTCLLFLNLFLLSQDPELFPNLF